MDDMFENILHGRFSTPESISTLARNFISNLILVVRAFTSIIAEVAVTKNVIRILRSDLISPPYLLIPSSTRGFQKFP